MSKDKRFDRICAIVMAAALVITVLFMNGTSLGLQAVVDEDTEANEGNTYFTANDLDGEWDDSAATVITLNGDSASIKGTGAYFSDGDLVIKNAGWYVISGELTDGSIIVNTYKSSKVWIRLNGVTVNCSDDSAFIVTKADKVFLTLAEGSENTFADTSAYSDEALEEGRNAAVYSKEDLTINGSGILTVTGNYKHGIKCNDDLAVTGGTISVTSLKDGINANDSLHLTGADITIDAGDDAVHCDTEIYYADGSLLVTSCYEGLEAPQIEIAGGDIVIYASDDGINANGGSDSALGMMGGGMGGMQYTALSDQEGTNEAVEDNTSGDGGTAEDAESATVLITGGNITIINENGRDADGIDSNGDIIIEGGNILVSLTDGGGNNALDYGSESGGQLLINGGTVLAAGSSSMMEAASGDSAQCNVTYTLESSAEAGTVVQIKDADSNVLLEKEIPCSFSGIIISSSDFTEGETYTAVIGEVEEELLFDTVTITSGSVSDGMGFGMAGGMGGFNNGGGPQNSGAGNVPGPMEDMSELTDEEREQMMENMQQMQPPQGDMPQMPADTGNAADSAAAETAADTASAGAAAGNTAAPVDTSTLENTADETAETGEFPQGGPMNSENMSERGMHGMNDAMGGGPGMGGMQEQNDDIADEETADGKKALTEYSGETWVMLGASLAVMLLGLIFAGLFKRRG